MVGLETSADNGVLNGTSPGVAGGERETTPRLLFLTDVRVKGHSYKLLMSAGLVMIVNYSYQIVLVPPYPLLLPGRLLLRLRAHLDGLVKLSNHLRLVAECSCQNLLQFLLDLGNRLHARLSGF